jgi:predicted RNase H-like HicB family nuclease
VGAVHLVNGFSGGRPMKLTAIIEAEGDGYVSLCPELDIASQGDSIAEARENLREALELFFESASPEEIKERCRRAFENVEI